VSVKVPTCLALGRQMAFFAHGGSSGRDVGLCTQASYEESEDLDSESAGSRSGSEESAAAGSPRAAGQSSLALFATSISQLPRPRCSAVGVRLLFAAVAAVSLTAYAGYQVWRSPPPGANTNHFRLSMQHHLVLTPTGLTARKLLESPQLTAIASEQIMSTGNAALNDDDRQMVNSVASAGFGNLSLMLERRAPDTARRLGAFQLSEEQASSVLGVVRHMSDARVQNLGRELTHALREFLHTSPTKDRANMGLHVRQALQPRLEKIRRLRDEVIPPSLRRKQASGIQDWGLSLNTDQMRVVKSFDNDWQLEFDMSRPKRVLGRQVHDQRRLTEKATKPYGVAGAVVEQARVTLDQLKAVLDQYGIQTEVPAWVSSFDGSPRPFLWDLLKCVEETVGDVSLAISCPMRFASAGLDIFANMRGGKEEKVEKDSNGLSKSVLWRNW